VKSKIDLESMRIGQVAKRTGVGIETIRFYEREGLINKPGRLESGYRQFSEEAVKRIYFIRRAKELGFSLKEIRELLALRVSSKATCGQVKLKTDAKIKEIEIKIKDLQRVGKSLLELSEACSNNNASVADCPILDCFETGGCK